MGQMANLYQRETQARRNQDASSAAPKAPHLGSKVRPNSTMDDDIEDVPPEIHHRISPSKNHPIYIAPFQQEHSDDPAVKVSARIMF
jgi:hypothetical protein